MSEEKTVAAPSHSSATARASNPSSVPAAGMEQQLGQAVLTFVEAMDAFLKTQSQLGLDPNAAMTYVGSTVSAMLKGTGTADYDQMLKNPAAHFLLPSAAKFIGQYISQHPLLWKLRDHPACGQALKRRLYDGNVKALQQFVATLVTAEQQQAAVVTVHSGLAPSQQVSVATSSSEPASLNPKKDLPPNQLQALAHNESGYHKAAFNNHAAAILDYNEAIHLDPTNPIYYDNRGASKYAQNQHAEAIKDFSEAIRLKPTEASYYRHRARAYEKLGQHQAAQNDRHQEKTLAAHAEPAEHLYKAILNGKKNRALELLAVVHQQDGKNSPQAATPHGKESALFTLARFGHLWLDDFLKHINPDTVDEQGNSALHVAAHHGHSEFYNALIERTTLEARVGGGYHWPRNAKGETPLHAAAAGGQVKFLLYCLDTYSAEQDLQVCTANGDTVVHLMVQHGEAGPLKTLLMRCRFLSVRTQNQAGLDPLMLALQQKPTTEAGREKQRQMVDVLLEQHIDLANRDTQGRTALTLAVQSGDPILVKRLLDKGALIDVSPDKNDHSKIGILLAEHTRNSKRQRQHFQQKPREWQNLVFQGGSIKGLAYPAALRELIDRGVCSLDKIQRVGGTSAGAINALLIGLGYSLEEMEHLMGVRTIPGSTLPQVKFAELLDGPFGEKLLAAKNQNWESLLGKDYANAAQKIKQIDGVLVGLARLLDGTAIRGVGAALTAKRQLTETYHQLDKHLALCPGEKLYELFAMLIQQKYAEKVGYAITTPVTFAELHKAGFKDMYFVGVNTHTGEAEYFSHEHTPDMVVASAVRISMSIPGVFYPVPKLTKDAHGVVNKSTDLYVDGGVTCNYPINLFDFAGYEEGSPLPAGHHQINQHTLGLRLVPPQEKTRYEGPTPSHPSKSESGPAAVPTLLGHVKETLHAIYNKQESDHALSGDGFRTIYINTLDVGMLDFERVEEEAVKKQLATQGKEGVKDFVERTQHDVTASMVQLPDALETLILKHSKVVAHKVEKGQCTVISKLSPNCPELVEAFYAYGDVRIHAYLHDSLKISRWARDQEGMTAFHHTARNGNIESLKRLLQADPQGANATDYVGKTPEQLTQLPEIITLLKSYAALPLHQPTPSYSKLLASSPPSTPFPSSSLSSLSSSSSSPSSSSPSFSSFTGLGSPYFFASQSQPPVTATVKMPAALGEKKTAHVEQSLYEELLAATLTWGSDKALAATLDASKQEQGKTRKSAEQLKTMAAQWGYSCNDMPEEGNCFYHAVGDQLKQQLNLAVAPSHETLRAIATQHILDNLSLYRDHTLDINKFIDDLSKPGEWADELHMAALSRALNVTICAIRSDGAAPSIYKQRQACLTLYLGYEVGVHYQSLKAVNDLSIAQVVQQQAKLAEQINQKSADVRYTGTLSVEQLKKKLFESSTLQAEEKSSLSPPSQGAVAKPLSEAATTFHMPSVDLNLNSNLATQQQMLGRAVLAFVAAIETHINTAAFIKTQGAPSNSNAAANYVATVISALSKGQAAYYSLLEYPEGNSIPEALLPCIREQMQTHSALLTLQTDPHKAFARELKNDLLQGRLAQLKERFSESLSEPVEEDNAQAGLFQPH